MRTMVSFTNCPECGISYGSQGLPRHRRARHGVAIEPQSRKAKPKRLSVAERLAKLNEA